MKIACQMLVRGLEQGRRLPVLALSNSFYLSGANIKDLTIMCILQLQINSLPLNKMESLSKPSDFSSEGFLLWGRIWRSCHNDFDCNRSGGESLFLPSQIDKNWFPAYGSLLLIDTVTDLWSYKWDSFCSQLPNLIPCPDSFSAPTVEPFME